MSTVTIRYTMMRTKLNKKYVCVNCGHKYKRVLTGEYSLNPLNPLKTHKENQEKQLSQMRAWLKECPKCNCKNLGEEV